MGRNFFKTTLLLAFLTGILIFIGGIIGGRSGMLIAFGIAAVMNFGAYWFSDKIVLKMYKAQPVTPENAPNLYAVVQELATTAKLPLPKIYIIEDINPNAFATGRNPDNAAVAVTTGILKILNREELKGVMGHELTHVRNRDTLIGAIAATIAGAVGMLANWLQWGAMFGGSSDSNRSNNGISMAGGLIIALLAPIMASMIQFAISRSREYAADKGGAEISGDPLALASALEKLQRGNIGHSVQGAAEHPSTAHLFIVNPLAGKKITNLFATHPDINERIANLQKMSATGEYPS